MPYFSYPRPKNGNEVKPKITAKLFTLPPFYPSVKPLSAWGHGGIYHSSFWDLSGHHLLWGGDSCSAFHPRAITVKASFQPEWYFLTKLSEQVFNQNGIF